MYVSSPSSDMFSSFAASDANSSLDVLVIRHICRLSLPRPGAPASQRVGKKNPHVGNHD